MTKEEVLAILQAGLEELESIQTDEIIRRCKEIDKEWEERRRNET